METKNAILTAVKENEEITDVLVDLLTRITQIKNINCDLLDKINAKGEKGKSVVNDTVNDIVRDALKEAETKISDLAYDFGNAIGSVIQSKLLDIIYYKPNNA